MADYADRQAANDRSKLDAEHHGEEWSAEEDELIRETMNKPVDEVAYVLDRSIFATVQRRSVVKLQRQTAQRLWRDTQQSRNARAESMEAEYGERCPRCGTYHRGEC